MKYLSVDFGLKRVGLAVSSGKITTPLQVLDYKDRRDLIEKILRTCRDEEITDILVGIPEQDRIGAEKFARELEVAVSLKIVRFNEDSTTQVALEKIEEAMVKKKKRKRIDHFAAAILLQNFLESRDDENYR